VLPDRKRAPPPKASSEVHHYKFEMQHSHRVTKKLSGWFWGFLETCLKNAISLNFSHW